ncbi:hypothetical protein RclHR1_01270017 [Rhizophagus clarus]|uniref:intramembrane prenyl-peptidase Rce1 n=1 Tax=Rhizophagus clarus TaxID=94130 RepID=A0A2Z6QNE8_9GLOM|nr:hypothetical protein RclHR1_01270017 [Rhizophagus clarus]GET02405.1 ABI-domain-containing protein [Rhizophagus clarus]
MGVNLDYIIRSDIDPIIPPSYAILNCVFFTLCFVGGLYFSKTTRIGSNNPQLTKDHPHVILNRGFSVIITCLISFTGVWFLIRLCGGFENSASILTEINTTWVLLGFSFPSRLYYLLNTVLIPLGLSMSLFIGPLFIKFLDKELPFQAAFNWRDDVFDYIGSLIGFRNLIFAPMTEEFVFRCCMVPLLALANFSHAQIIFLSPLVFGIAHVHHAWETYVSRGRTVEAAKVAILISGFQLTYTTLFGWYATFLFMRTGHFIPPFFAHMFCNIMGFPSINLSTYSEGIKKVVIITLIGGVIIFVPSLFPATNPGLYREVGKSIYWYNNETNS